MECIGKVVCNPLEEIWISLQEVQGKPHLEIRMYGTPAAGNADPIPRREAITLPIDQLPSLLRVLAQVKEACVNRGLLYAPAPAASVTMQGGNEVTVPLLARGYTARKFPRVPVQLRAECRLVDPERFWTANVVAGEIRDLSLGGAQIWLRQRLPRFKQADLAFIIDGKGFQARAQIVSVGLESHKDPKTGFHRHGLSWVAMVPKMREVLTEAIAKRLKPGEAEARPPDRG